MGKDKTKSLQRRARIVALQSLFEMTVAYHAPEESLQRLVLDHPIPQAGMDLAQVLVQGVVKHLKNLDQTIATLAPAWPPEQLALVDRNVLRIALYEILMGSTPPKVAINEAVEIAKLFGTESSSRFVNGVLGAVIDKQECTTIPKDYEMCQGR